MSTKPDGPSRDRFTLDEWDGRRWQPIRQYTDMDAETAARVLCRATDEPEWQVGRLRMRKLPTTEDKTMGEIAEMIIDGVLCQSCGVLMPDIADGSTAPGYPRDCPSCAERDEATGPLDEED